MEQAYKALAAVCRATPLRGGASIGREEGGAVGGWRVYHYPKVGRPGGTGIAPQCVRCLRHIHKKHRVHASLLLRL